MVRIFAVTFIVFLKGPCVKGSGCRQLTGCNYYTAKELTSATGSTWQKV